MGSGIVRLICPNLLCRSMLSVPDAARGKEVKCRACGKRVVIPAKKAPSAITVAPTDVDAKD